MEKQCFVIQPFDQAYYDKLFDQVFQPAIVRAELKAYRVDRDPSASIPIEMIETGIKNSAVCFAEITTDNPNVWFELGYAISLAKPICMVCSRKRTKFPFDVQHRKIITYEESPSPSDFTNLGAEIKERLSVMLVRDSDQRQNKEVAVSLGQLPETRGLQPHELLALTIIMGDQLENGTSAWNLKREMERSGFTAAATSLAVYGLKAKAFTENKIVEDPNGEPYEAFFVSEKGLDWLTSNQDSLKLRIYEPQAEITDEDIPF